MLRKPNRFRRPKKPFEKIRIQEENVLVERYGLKNKREIWKTIAKVKYFRTRAKALARAGIDEQEVLFGKLRAIGLKVNSIADILDLKVENLLERRLPTIVAKKGIANTVKHARQLTVHKRILVDGKVVNIPSYIVPVAFENSIELKVKKKKAKIEIKEENKEISEDKKTEEVNEEAQ